MLNKVAANINRFIASALLHQHKEICLTRLFNCVYVSIND